jgi:hypothetical protein
MSAKINVNDVLGATDLNAFEIKKVWKEITAGHIIPNDYWLQNENLAETLRSLIENATGATDLQSMPFLNTY